MTGKPSSLKSSIDSFIRQQGIEVEMEQNLVKETIHLHLLSAMSDALESFDMQYSRAVQHCASATTENAIAKISILSVERAAPTLVMLNSKSLLKRRSKQRRRRLVGILASPLT